MNISTCHRVSVVVAALAVATLSAAGVAEAKEGSSRLGKNRPDPVVTSSACVEKPVADAWAGLTLSPWSATNTATGEQWTLSFDDRGKAVYTRGSAAKVTGTYTQPLRVYDASGRVVLSSPGAEVGSTSPFVVPHSHCTMTWYTSTGPLFMVRS